jgi:predicted phosphate transport protein (TIGR00153 family)
LSDNKGTILDWFKVRRESVIMKGVRNHAQKIGDTVSELNRAMAALTDSDKERALDAIKRLIYSEKEADNLEEMISEELSKGDMEAKEREDLLHLTQNMDNVADWAKEAGMNLQLIIEANVSVPLSMWRKYAEMTKELDFAAKQLRNCVDSLGVNNDAVLTYGKSVSLSEHKLDDMYFSTKKEILFAELDPRSIYLMRDLLHGIENSSDSCKDSADIIHILVISQIHKAR